MAFSASICFVKIRQTLEGELERRVVSPRGPGERSDRGSGFTDPGPCNCGLSDRGVRCSSDDGRGVGRGACGVANLRLISQLIVDSFILIGAVGATEISWIFFF